MDLFWPRPYCLLLACQGCQPRTRSCIIQLRLIITILSFISAQCNCTFKCSPTTNWKPKVTAFQQRDCKVSAIRMDRLTLEHGTKVLPRGPGNVMHGSDRAVICTFAAFFQAVLHHSSGRQWQLISRGFGKTSIAINCTPSPPTLSQNQKWHQCPSV